MPLLIALVTFASVTLFITYLIQPRPDRIRRRMLEGGAANALSRERTLEASPLTRLVLPVIQKLGATLGQLLPQNLIHNVNMLLLHAGEPMPLATFLSVWFLLG